ncbi:hypothetical protein [Rhodococcus oryzae]|uniref:Uncharacterized protein n=1 Tax=Rhodococcus oryzae TaxID=2571143 RepID=A0ABY2RLE8_9NOCA|nr:hypothetical protein [Rhodococcus oryzae]TJZ78578.1 hypothetical protein FCG67_11185 [Rhodococcus oryzae]
MRINERQALTAGLLLSMILGVVFGASAGSWTKGTVTLLVCVVATGLAFLVLRAVYKNRPQV